MGIKQQYLGKSLKELLLNAVALENVLVLGFLVLAGLLGRVLRLNLMRTLHLVS